MNNNFKITSASVSDRGLSEKRPENEDSFLVIDDRGVYAVADGVGGAQAGDVASQMAMEILGEAFMNQTADRDAEDVMRAAIDSANSAIYQMANDLPQLSSMATTIVALHLDGNIATIGNVGDSRLYRLDRYGNLRRETNDHSVVEEEVRAGRMTPEQAMHHPSKNVISRALGAESDVDIDLKTIMVEPGTTLMLCSDGITRHVDDGEIGRFLATDAAPSEICARLKDLCYERGAEDNLTAVVVRVASEREEEYSVAAAGAGSDGEEATIASARSSFDRPAPLEAEVKESDDFATQDTVNLDEINELDDGAYLMEDAEEDTEAPRKPDLHDYTSSSVIVPAQQTVQQPAPPTAQAPAIGRPYTEPVVEERQGTLSKLLSALLFLLLGAVVGAGGYYFWVQSQPERVVEVPVLNEAKSNNIPLTAFEELRRVVDKDPNDFIMKNAASPQDAEDFFLLGRAFMQVGKYWEAKRFFNDARNRLATADPNNAKTLAAEISMALAIIESPQATETFTRDMTTANTAAPSNSNTNAGPQTLPIR